MKRWLNENWLKVVAIGGLLGALTNVPYVTYYQLMDWVVLGAAVMVVWQAKKRGILWLTWLFAFVAVLFNPVAPIYLQQDIWRITDIVVVSLFLLSLGVMRERKE